ncbi:MAG: DUF2075 domain-containing protein [Acetobacteraceae bacterium]|nr:DUF2075 domain-containing protein [Acetobacteraceae bacterium]
MRAAWQGSGTAFLARPAKGEVETLIQRALRAVPGAAGWHVALNVSLPRPGRRLSAVLALDRAVVALLMRAEGARFLSADRRAVEDAALDLAEGHAGSAGLPVVPVLCVLGGTGPSPVRPLPIAGAGPTVETNRLLLPLLLHEVALSFPEPTRLLDPARWAEAPWHWSPGLLQAACLLYARHGVQQLRTALADGDALAQTITALRGWAARAMAERRPTILFVTGPPGAGKTLVGLDLAFEPHQGAAYLTGNPTLVHVLQEALARDAASHGLALRAARQRASAVVQPLPAWRDHFATRPAEVPGSRVMVVDEAQRCWVREHAVAKTRKAAVPLQDSEPGHLLDAMARRADGPVLVCLCGGGQEIHAGEGGLANWGEALSVRPAWYTVAAPEALANFDPRQRLPDLPGLARDPALHLAVPRRQLDTKGAAAWADRVLAGDWAEARRLAATGPPVRVTRNLDAMREALRGAAQGSQTIGLVASSYARRLRAEGLGGTLPHQDEDAVARWFLDRAPDVRSAGALEVAGTEFAIQGLELDHVGLCWDLDLIPDGNGWAARAFRGSAWTRLRDPLAVQDRRNAYRVLLTRARRGTLVWVPRGDARDPTRPPALYDAVAATLLRCGAAPLDTVAITLEDRRLPDPVLL